ncbi:patatin-like protein [Paracoccus litorisediminis]|uniref:Patatin-like protein n=1 Tax=Paracoccus litorisediminis TaxID=2006130 RepID=A0A844HPH8_9RHOB|nr:patatin-like protein [Paracoccus litorisediminis]MTH60055.1 patatin-like protein [Paracoccus litorisediminis]
MSEHIADGGNGVASPIGVPEKNEKDVEEVHLNREIRFAVVLYGGTSLAIYMNGISQELLRMVRGSSELADKDLDPVEKVYRDISLSMPGGRTRFLVDIISGTSAGGINGVALAKALVLGSKNLKVLRDAWTDKANIDQLLNDHSVSRRSRTESVLDGGLMYEVLLGTLAGMDSADKGEPLADMVDLFVTATDLVGRKVPIQLTGESVDEPVHKTVFHFAYAANPEDSSKALTNDFTSNTMLAFAARCTSSFPVAFPPMRLSDVPPMHRRDEDLSRFFPKGDDYGSRVYADGGYLDTKPFSHAIDLIPFRSARLPGERKLLFVDPFPDGRSSVRKGGGEREIDFVTNARLAATTLPRREVIRDDIRQIHTMNRRLERLGALQDRWKTDQKKLALDESHEPQPLNIDKLYLADLVSLKGYGDRYPLYHHLRVYSTTDMLSNLVAGIAGIEQESVSAAYLRQLVRTWRDSMFNAYDEADERRSETAFLSDYDLDFRRRRLVHLRAEAKKHLDDNRNNNAVRNLWCQIDLELIRLGHLVQPAQPNREILLGNLDIAGLTAALEKGYPKFAGAIDLPSKYQAAIYIYKGEAKLLVDAAMQAIGTYLRGGFDDASARIRDVLADPPLKSLLAEYERFHWHDVVTFPFLEGTTAEEHAEVQVFRISPADSKIDPSPGKLAGISYGAFGGFLSKDWREHDILWGRLDGAERIVAALIPDPTDPRRTEFTEKLQDEILTEEFGEIGKDRRQAMLRRLTAVNMLEADKLKAIQTLFDSAPPIKTREDFGILYGKPLDPETPQLIRWANRAGLIFSKMLDDLPDNGALAGLGRVAPPLRAGSVLAARLTLFATPGRYPGMLAERGIFLLILLGVILFAISILVHGSASPWLGLGFILLGVGLWSLLYVVERILRDRSPLPDAAHWILILIVLAMAVVGLVTVVQFGKEIAHRTFPAQQSAFQQ